MNFICNGHAFENEIQTISQVFYNNENFARAEEVSDLGVTVVSSLDEDVCRSEVYANGQFLSRDEETVSASDEKQLKLEIKTSMYRALTKATGYTPPWGVLTGIRPTKIVHDLFDKGLGEAEVLATMKNKYLASDEKLELCVDVAKRQRPIVLSKTQNKVSLYVGIPFCPTRCYYCSFTSFPISKFEDYVDTYLDCLIKELDACAKLIKEKHLQTVYIGGGTPTSLDARRLERLLEAVYSRFNVKSADEFTVEAGRPDTLDMEKLALMKKYEVTRLSVNTQTLNDKTLEKIGRGHTADDFFKAFDMARECGHKSINVDLIMGLPNEGIEEATKTLEQVLTLNPENLTIHTLSVKRASKLKEDMLTNAADFNLYSEVNVMEKILQTSRSHAQKMGLLPYYMYRQKNMLGGFENVGYSKAGHEGLYNVHIMEETQTIVAAGAGAITKTVDLKTNRIERITNMKDVFEYIKRIDEVVNKKILNL